MEIGDLVIVEDKIKEETRVYCVKPIYFPKGDLYELELGLVEIGILRRENSGYITKFYDGAEIHVDMPYETGKDILVKHLTAQFGNRVLIKKPEEIGVRLN